jgi:hypothetical protein
VLTFAISATGEMRANNAKTTDTHSIRIARIQIVRIIDDTPLLVVLGGYLEEIFGKIGKNTSI